MAGSNCTNPLLEPPSHSIGRSHGGLSSKIHQFVDGIGLSLAALVALRALSQTGDSPMFLTLIAQRAWGVTLGFLSVQPRML